MAARPALEERPQVHALRPGEIIATDNGDATSFESFQSPERKAFNGLVLAIVRTKAGEPGPLTSSRHGRRPARRLNLSYQPAQ